MMKAVLGPLTQSTMVRCLRPYQVPQLMRRRRVVETNILRTSYDYVCG